MVDGARSRERHVAVHISTALFKIKNGRATRYTTADGLASNRVRSNSCSTSDGVVWIGTTGGVTTYDKGVFTSQIFGAPVVLRRQRDHLRSRRQPLDWIADARVSIRARSGQFTSYAARDGLPADYVGTVHRRQSGHDVDRHQCRSRDIPRWALSADLTRQRPSAVAGFLVGRRSAAHLVGGHRTRRLQIETVSRLSRRAPAIRSSSS